MKTITNLLKTVGVIMLFQLFSCAEQDKNAIYVVGEGSNDSLYIPLLQWDIVGAMRPLEKDSALSIWEKEYLHAYQFPEDSLIADPYRYRDSIYSKADGDTLFNRFYTPSDHLVDLKEVYHINPNDTTLPLRGSASYMFCTIQSAQDTQKHLIIKTPLDVKLWLNSEPLTRTEIGGFDTYRISLKKGDNTLVLKTVSLAEDCFLEAYLCGEERLAEEYCRTQIGGMIWPIIFPENKTIMITNSHQNLLDSDIMLDIYDTRGKTIFSHKLLKDTATYYIPELEIEESYMCRMTIGKASVFEAVLCGTADNAYKKFTTLRAKLSDNHPMAAQIDQILFRYFFLLNHESRYNDWFWQFKITPLTYQLENIFSHLEDEAKRKEMAADMQLMTYTSELDGSSQRYLLITPDHMPKDARLPLVVVVRPHVENHYHFFTSPQMARLWALTHAQALADKYNYVVMMPEARMYLSEDLMPFAESEMKLAIRDVQKQYNIDEDRIYLHANCTGAYRALRMAVQNPGLFAAIGLYAPSYYSSYESEWSRQNSPHLSLDNIKSIPMLIHYDPYDTHSPYRLYKDLIRDCKKKDIPLTLSTQRYSGRYYNVLLAGEETFGFFKDKKRVGGRASDCSIYDSKRHSSGAIVADVYAQPFIFVYNSSDKSEAYLATVDSIQSEYEKYLYSTLPLVPSNKVQLKDLTEKNIVFIGHRFDNAMIDNLISSLSLDLKYDKVKYSNVTSQSVHKNPKNPEKLIVVYTANPIESFSHTMPYPWINGVEDKVLIYKDL